MENGPVVQGNFLYQKIGGLVPLKEGYNGDLTSAQAGSIGGEMVKKMIMKQEEQMSSK